MRYCTFSDHLVEPTPLAELAFLSPEALLRIAAAYRRTCRAYIERRWFAACARAALERAWELETLARAKSDALKAERRAAFPAPTDPGFFETAIYATR